MPLSMLDFGSTRRILKVIGQDKVRHHLNNLGLVEGAEVEVVNSMAGNLILNVKNTRVALDKALANKIIVE